MADEKKEDVLGRTDKYFSRISEWLSARISAFVAFLFLLFGAGALYATFIIPRLPEFGPYLLAAPFVLALIAYYNRTAATILFAGLLLMFVL
jgi:hypothetical protein